MEAIQPCSGLSLLIQRRCQKVERSLAKECSTVHPGTQVETRLPPGLGSSTVDQVLKYTKYPKHLPSTSTGQVLIFL